jgi:carbon monoxide dehydrogenase subunit G
MHFAGQVAIRASRDRVWAFLIDPNQVGPCGPGVESVEVVDATHCRARAKVGVGFVSARFAVDLEIAEQDPPARAVIRAHGQAPGSAVDATAAMTLGDGENGATVMDWTADVAIAGTIASVGARLIEGTANKMIGQTFDCIRSRLEAPAEATASP